MDIRHVVTAVILSVGLTACGGSDDGSAASDFSEPATPSAPETSAYSLDDREAFLAGGPSCDELKSWYEQFPSDTDGLTALRFVEECNEAPEPVLDGDIFAGSNDRLLEALLEPDVAGASRSAAHSAIAQGVCSLFGSGDGKSLWLVASDVQDFGGTAQDYAATIDAAVEECPSSEEDLRLFTTDDVLGATTELSDLLIAAGVDSAAVGADAEVAGLAAVTCSSLNAGDSMADASLLFTALLPSPSDAESVGEQAAELFCPESI